VNGLRVAEGTALGHLDRVDVADQVAHAGVRRGQLLAVPLPAVPPGHRQVVAELGGEAPAPRAHRGERVVVDLAPGDRRRPLIEQPGERADQARLALAALAQQDHIVTGDDGPLQVRQNRLAEADDPGERVLARAHAGQQVPPDFLLYRRELVIARAKFA
jgi:hypothetical protein